MYQQHINEVRATQIHQDLQREAAVERSLRAAGSRSPEEEIPDFRFSVLRRMLHALSELGRRHATGSAAH